MPHTTSMAGTGLVEGHGMVAHRSGERPTGADATPAPALHAAGDRDAGD